MVEESYFIKLKDHSSQEDFGKVIAYLKHNRAQIVMASMQKQWVIVNLNQILIESLRKFPAIQILGGITFQQRVIKVVRTQKL